eukprot:305822-Pelagomonas_calceolata.AAC.1
MLLHASGVSCSAFNLTPHRTGNALFTPLHRVVTRAASIKRGKTHQTPLLFCPGDDRRQQPRFSQPCIAGAASSSFSSGGEPAPESDFQPFPRTKERNPYK